MKTENQNNSLPISAIVCTLNEEKNIVVVVHGGAEGSRADGDERNVHENG